MEFGPWVAWRRNLFLGRADVSEDSPWPSDAAVKRVWEGGWSAVWFPVRPQSILALPFLGWGSFQIWSCPCLQLLVFMLDLHTLTSPVHQDQFLLCILKAITLWLTFLVPFYPSVHSSIRLSFDPSFVPLVDQSIVCPSIHSWDRPEMSHVPKPKVFCSCGVWWPAANVGAPCAGVGPCFPPQCWHTSRARISLKEKDKEGVAWGVVEVRTMQFGCRALRVAPLRSRPR